MTVPDPAAALTALYDERNALALAFAALAADRGWTVGRVVDHADQESDWPVLLVVTPMGQFSWHLPWDSMPLWVPARPDLAWDGHTTADKYDRLATMSQALGILSIPPR